MFFSGVNQPAEASRGSNIWANDQMGSSSTNGSQMVSSWGEPELNRSHIPICKFFLTNSCRLGKSCKFAHVLPGSGFTEHSICEICSEDVLLKGCKFGLLENCDHVFCLNCIREWRNQKEKQDRLNLRKCPICRVDSFLIIPSAQFLSDEAKAAERESYCNHVSGIPCKNFAAGKCQFGSSCLYRHDTAQVDEFTILKGADGRRTKKGSQLSDFLKI